MLEFGFVRFVTEEELIIQEEDNSFTDDYVHLTSEYYMNLKSAPSSARENNAVFRQFVIQADDFLKNRYLDTI